MFAKKYKCTYMYICVCICIRIHIGKCPFSHAKISVFTYVYGNTYLNIYTYTYIQICIDRYIYICIYVYTDMKMYTEIHVHTYIQTKTYTCIICIYIHMYIYLHVTFLKGLGRLYIYLAMQLLGRYHFQIIMETKDIEMWRKTFTNRGLENRGVRDAIQFCFVFFKVNEACFGECLEVFFNCTHITPIIQSSRETVV